MAAAASAVANATGFSAADTSVAYTTLYRGVGAFAHGT